MKRTIYADHAATTVMSQAAMVAMRPFLTREFGNPSSLYFDAREPRKAIEEARKSIANDIGAQPDDIVFTSGGSESDNWALKGRAFIYPNRRKKIITTSIEHHAILNSADFLERCGYDVIRLPVNQNGVVSPEVLDDVLEKNHQDTVLVSCMMANNEIGTIEPIAQLAEVSHRYGVPFHTDAVQAIGHIHVDVERLGIDMLSASAHKFNGPRGVGFLYLKKGVRLVNLIDGGAQESGHRAGTENTAGIVGMATALHENVVHMDRNIEKLQSLSEGILSGLKRNKIDFRMNGPAIGERLPGNLNVSFAKCDGESMLHRLDLMGIEVSTGSACNSRETVISHVLKAINVPDEYIGGTLRITLGEENTLSDVDSIINAVTKIIGSSGISVG